MAFMTSKLHAVPNQFPFAPNFANLASTTATPHVDPLQHEIPSQFDLLYLSSTYEGEIPEG